MGVNHNNSRFSELITKKLMVGYPAVEVTAAPAVLNNVATAVGTVAFDRMEKIKKLTLAAVDTAGGILSWLNPEAGPILVVGFFLYITTPATAACTASFGTTTTSATTLSANLITGLDVHTAGGLFDDDTDIGASGKTRQLLAQGGWITGSTASGASAGLVGSAYVRYFLP
jgi:hypothetical protein